MEQSEENLPSENTLNAKKKKASRKIDRAKVRSSPERELPGRDIKSDTGTSSDEDTGKNELISDYLTVEFDELKEYEDTVPESMKQEIDKGRNITRKRRKKSNKSAFERQFEAIQKKLVNSCECRDVELLAETLGIYQSLPETVPEDGQCEKGGYIPIQQKR